MLQLVSTAEWVVVSVQVAATLIAAVSAVAAWRAAKASRDAVRDQREAAKEQQVAARRARLEDVYDTLVSLRGALDESRYDLFELHRLTLGRQLAVIADAPLPLTKHLSATNPTDMTEFEALCDGALTEVHDLLLQTS
jgi:hypothetical protein